MAMATGADDPGDKSTKTQSTSEPTRPTEVRRSVAWPDSASMPAQQSAANRMFRQNSERMQGAAEAKRGQAQEQAAPQRTLTFAKDRGRGNYAELRQATQAAQQNQQVKGQESGERKLPFAKDGQSHTQDNPTKDQAKAAGKELTFQKDRGHDPSRGR